MIFEQDIGADDRWDRSENVARLFLKSGEPLKQGIRQKVQYRYLAKGYESSILIGKYKSKTKIKVLRKNESNYAMSIYLDDVVIEKVSEPLEPRN